MRSDSLLRSLPRNLALLTGGSIVQALADQVFEKRTVNDQDGSSSSIHLSSPPPKQASLAEGSRETSKNRLNALVQRALGQERANKSASTAARDENVTSDKGVEERLAKIGTDMPALSSRTYRGFIVELLLRGLLDEVSRASDKDVATPSRLIDRDTVT